MLNELMNKQVTPYTPGKVSKAHILGKVVSNSFGIASLLCKQQPQA